MFLRMKGRGRPFPLSVSEIRRSLFPRAIAPCHLFSPDPILSHSMKYRFSVPFLLCLLDSQGVTFRGGRTKLNARTDPK